MPPTAPQPDNSQLNIERALEHIARAIENNSGVSAYTNSSSDGGTFYYVNLGGIKILWGMTPTIAINAVVRRITINFPSGFFTNVLSVTAGMATESSGQRLTATGETFSASAATIIAWDTSGSTSNSGKINILVIGN